MSQQIARPKGSRSEAPRTRYEDDLYTSVGEQVALPRAGLILAHMLKWDHQPERRSRSWANRILAQRDQYADVLVESPGLKSKRADALRSAYRVARREASSETDLPVGTFPEACPYDWPDILERPFDFDAIERGEVH